MTRVGDALAALRAQLAAASPSASLDAEVLVAQVLGTGRASLAADPGRSMAPEELLALESLVRRRMAGEPVAYLTGRREFWSLDLEVTPDVLVPRPETELLVERALEVISGIENAAVLDLGTGSGAIAIAIAAERPDAAVTATDVSAAALAVAMRNAASLGLRNLGFCEGTWYAPLRAARFDVIVSNPPYVATGDPALDALKHEPMLALVGGNDGLDALKAVASGASAHLAPAGWLLLEHGASQGDAVRSLLCSAGLAKITTRADLAGYPRVTEGAMAR